MMGMPNAEASPNDERMTKSECRSDPDASSVRVTGAGAIPSFGFWASGFFRHSDFDIRH
jgi:hypothetical protein